MDITEYKTKTYRLTNLENLDPVLIYCRTIPGQNTYGIITVTCYGEAWSASFGSIGDKSVEQFIASCDEYYLSGKFSSDSDEADFDKINYATGLSIGSDFELGMAFNEVCEHFEPVDIPRRKTSKHMYLIRICRAVIDAMKQVTGK